MSMSVKTLSEASVKLTSLGSSEFTIRVLADVKVSSSMYHLARGEYKYGVQVAGVVIPAETESNAKAIAEKMAGLILEVALEARKS